MALPQPRRPNILLTGTPGTGKTTMAEMLAAETGMRHINVGTWVKEKELHDGRNDEFDCFTLNEDKLCDEMEDIMVEGGNIVDFHSCDFFPERWFHLILVLRTENQHLYERLEQRGYKQNKINENMEAEIMQVTLDAARESGEDCLVHELPSNTVEDMGKNVEQIKQWLSTLQV